MSAQENMKYDDASWHYGGKFPEGSPKKYGATHIALIMKWCFIKGWAGEIHRENSESNSELQKVISGELNATDFFMKWSDGKLTDEDFNEDGNEFLMHYYAGENEQYTPDYADNFGHLMYVENEQAHDFGKFSSMVEKRYKEFKRLSKPWWKLW